MKTNTQSQKPCVLIVENSIDITGALKSIVRTCMYNAVDFDFIFLLPEKSKASLWLKEQGFKQVEYLPMLELSKSFKSFIYYFPVLISNTWKLKKIVKHYKVDLIHNNDLYNLLPVSLLIFGVKIPYITHIRFLPNRFPKPLYLFWVRIHLFFSENIIAVSNYLADSLPKSSKIHTIYNELPIELTQDPIFKPVHRERVFLYLSNYIQGKGQDYAIKAFASASDHLQEWKLRFVGGDMGLEKNLVYKRKLLSLSKELGVENKIEWQGFTNDVETEYKQAEIVLNFSESESFSLTCLEAIYFGTPVIATKSGGPAEIIVHGKSGYLVENKDIQGMSDAMKVLAKNDKLRREVNLLGPSLMEEKFNPQRTSKRLSDLYKHVLSL